VQPIAVRDVLAYLTGVLGNRDAYGQVFEVGGADVVTYRDMMDLYASVAGLRKRMIVPVPVLSPRLSSLWVGLVTPIPADLARPLIDSLVNEVVVRDHAIDRVVPHYPIGCRDAIALALQRVGELDVSTRWTDAELYGRSPADPIPTDPGWAGATVLVDRQVVNTSATPEALYREICALGGEQGWLVGADFLPSTAINQLEMWQAETFDTVTINRELGWAHNIGMNVMRVYLHDLAWQADPAGFKGRMNTYLSIASKNKIKTLFTVFDDCWNPDPAIGRQHCAAAQRPGAGATDAGAGRAIGARQPPWSPIAGNDLPALGTDGQGRGHLAAAAGRR